MESFESFKSFRHAGETFVKELLIQLKHLKVHVEDLTIDHVCFRVATFELYNQYKKFLGSFAQLLTETMVNGRLIATYRLSHPFTIDNRRISLVELPAPKPGADYATGFEHAEFVLKKSFAEFKSAHPEVVFNESGNPTINPELTLATLNGQAKFHYVPLDRVIEIENAKPTDIIFDFDGTIIQSREIIYKINQQVFSKLLNRDVSLDEVVAKFFPNFSDLFEAFDVTDLSLKHQAIQDWATFSHLFSYPLFKGILELLNELHAHGFRLHLWTARDRTSCLKILEAHNLTHLFTSLSFSSAASSKPQVHNLELDWPRAPANSLVMVGDSCSDMLGAKNINAIAAAAMWDPDTNTSAVISAGAELYFNHVNDFRQWLHGRKFII